LGDFAPYAPYIGLGSSMAATVLLSLALGYWADRRFGTEPVLFLTFGLFGVLAAFAHLYAMVRGRKP